MLSISFEQHNAAGRREWNVTEYGLSPTRVEAKAGTPLTWANKGAMAHTLVARDGSWKTRTIGPGESASVTIDKPGTYVYACR